MREADLERHLVGDDEKKAADALKAKLDAAPDVTQLPPEKKDKDGSKAKGAPTSGLPDQDGKTAGSGAANVAATDNKAEEKPIEYKPLNGVDGKPVDFILLQAMNQLKGLPVASSPRALLASAGTAPAALKPKLGTGDKADKSVK